MSEHLEATPALLAATDLFAGLPPAALERVATSARVRKLRHRERGFNQGDDHVRVHALFSGWVRVSQTGSDGNQVVVRFIGPGTIFGVMAPFTDGRYQTDATAVLEAAEASWSEADLLGLMQAYPGIAVNMVRILGRRLQEMQERARELATQRADRRIAHALLRILGKTGLPAENGITIPFPLRRRDIADMAGTTLYTASRILAGWESAATVESRHRLLTIRDLHRLRRMAEQEDE